MCQCAKCANVMMDNANIATLFIVILPHCLLSHCHIATLFIAYCHIVTLFISTLFIVLSFHQSHF